MAPIFMRTARLSGRFLLAIAALCLLSIRPATGQTADKIIDRFVEACSKNDKLTDQQRSSVLELVDRLRKDELVRPMVLTEALRQLHTEYRAALADLGQERIEQAIDRLGNLAESKDSFLAADASFYLARAHIFKEQYEAALPLLEKIDGPLANSHLHSGEVLFLKGISQTNLLQNQQAMTTLSRYLQQHPQAPERMRVAAMRRLQLIQRIEEGSLSDVFQRMEFSRRRLALEDSGKQTQAEQEKIVDMLAKLIEEAQERENNSQGGGQGQNQQQASKPSQGKGKGEGQDQDGQGSKKQDQPDARRRVHRGGPKSPWSTLRDRQRDPAFSAIKANFPARYQQLIEQYYKSFQEEEKQRD